MGTKKNNLGVRIAMAVIGIALTAVSVGLQKISGLGVDPFSVIIFGFSNAFHATYQTVYIVVCAVLLSIAFIFNRKLLGIATVVNLFFSGFVTDATRKSSCKSGGGTSLNGSSCYLIADRCTVDFYFFSFVLFFRTWGISIRCTGTDNCRENKISLPRSENRYRCGVLCCRVCSGRRPGTGYSGVCFLHGTIYPVLQGTFNG